jgi:Mg-chelatase subunit ChlD
VTPRQFYRSNSKDRVRAVALQAGTTPSNFQQIAIAGGSVSKDLAARLAAASGGDMTEMEILYPERYESADEHTGHDAA